MVKERFSKSLPATPILIIGDHTQGLGIVRCLAGNRYKPVMIWDRMVSLSRFSKHLYLYRRAQHGTMNAIYTHSASSHLLSVIEALIPEGERWPVFTVHDDLVLFLHCNRKNLMEKLLIPENDIPTIIDKYRFAARLKTLGIDVPKTYLLSGFSKKYLNGSMQFVAKGRLGNRFRNISNRKGKILQNADDIDALIDYVDRRVPHDEVIIQEKIKDNAKVFSCCGFALCGKILRSFQYAKLRQYPDQFGTGTYLESIRRSQLIERSTRIVDAFSYTGIFEIEFIETADKRMVVIEMNPRTWKSIHFAALCGQNLCCIYYDFVVHGIVPEENHCYKIGKTWVDIVTDLPQAIKKRDFRGLLHDSATFHCVADLKDPLPFFMEILLSPLLAFGV